MLILGLIFLTSIGLGLCGNLNLNTVAVLFPSMFTTEAFASANVFAQLFTISSSQIAEIPAPVPMLILLGMAFNGIIQTAFL